jgi:hypothetical protein
MGETATRRELLSAAGALASRPSFKPIAIGVRVLFDQGAHANHGLTESERNAFARFQEQARGHFSISGLLFSVQFVEGAYLRKQGYSEIPDRFLARRCINLFVTDSLAYDIDRDRTGGCSIGPRPRGPRSAPDPFYKTFLGLRQARETTLEHEYAHHFTLDSARNPSASGNVWADLRNDYWLWLQRRGIAISGFRACANSEFAVPAQ